MSLRCVDGFCNLNSVAGVFTKMLVFVACLALPVGLASCGQNTASDTELEAAGEATPLPTAGSADSETPAEATGEGDSNVEIGQIDATPIGELEEITPQPAATSTPLPTATPVPLVAPTAVVDLVDTAFTNASKVTTVGIDEVFFGMLAADAAEAASTTWVINPDDEEASACYRVTPENGPDRVELWVIDGHVERVDVAHPDIRTPSQLGVGTTLEQLESQLGSRLETTENEDGTKTAVFTPADASDAEFRIVFELEDEKTVSYRSGRATVIDRLGEDC